MTSRIVGGMKVFSLFLILQAMLIILVPDVSGRVLSEFYIRCIK